MPSSSLDIEVRKILSRWTRNDYYVYIRPVSSKLKGETKHSVWWVVSVEYRTTPPGSWRGEGGDLDALIKDLDKSVPQRPKDHKTGVNGCPHVLVGGQLCGKPATHTDAHEPAPDGWLAPVSEMKKRRPKVEAQVLPFKKTKKKKAKK